MKRFALVFLLCTGCASTGTIYKPRVLEEYDSIENITYWTHTPIMLRNIGLDMSPAIFLQAGAICQGDVRNEPCQEPRYILSFQVQGQRLTSSSNLTLRIGQERLRPEPFTYGADTGGLTTFKEGFGFFIDEEQIRALAYLPEGEVEGRLAGMDLNLSYNRREGLRLLLDHLEAQ